MNAAYQDFLDAVASRDRYEANNAYDAVRGWLDRGGFEPEWSAEERAAFFRYDVRTGEVWS